MEIRRLKYNEIGVLEDFPPDDWRFDIIRFMEKWYGEDFFMPLVAVRSGKIVAVSNGIYTGRTGWIGNVIVKSGERRRGIGERLTRELMDRLQTWNCSTLLLIATREGAGLYQKLGFETGSNYLFYKVDQPLAQPEDANLRPITHRDHRAVFDIDRKATGEDRAGLLREFLKNGRVYDDGGVKGFFLPDFAEGPVVANTEAAGLALLHLKLTRKGALLAIPEENTAAHAFLGNTGFSHFASASRMYYGNDADWQPAAIFSRASGYCG